MLQEPDCLSMLINNKGQSRTPMTVYLNQDTIRKVDEITNMFKENTNQIISKSQFIDVAINSFSSCLEEQLSVKNLIRKKYLYIT